MLNFDNFVHTFPPILKILENPYTVFYGFSRIEGRHGWFTGYSEHGSTIVTTNLAFSEWTDLFVNTAMVAALVDRLTFRSYVLDMNGDSYRLDHSKNGA